MAQYRHETPEKQPKTDIKQATSNSGGSTRILEIGGLLLLLLVLIGMLQPAQNFRGPSKRTPCSHNLRHLGLAMLHYESAYGRLPPAYTVDEDGRPLHSWRALILPYLGEQATFDLIDFSRPWDDPVNKKAYETEMDVFRCPASNIPKGFTTYLALVTPNSCLRPKESCDLADIADGTSNTLTIVEAPESCAVHWMSPADADEELFLRFGEPEFKSVHEGGFNAARGDGSTKFIRDSTPPDVRRAYISVAGDDNEVLDQ